MHYYYKIQYTSPDGEIKEVCFDSNHEMRWAYRRFTANSIYATLYTRTSNSDRWTVVSNNRYAILAANPPLIQDLPDF